MLWVGVKAGISGFFTVAVLAMLETTFSFDNAIVNARILHRMSKFWQTIFMTLGIFIAVFVVRVLLPIAIVSLTSETGFREVVRLALHDTAVYGEKLELAHPLISSFGGIFLLMLFLDFVFESREVKWLKRPELLLEKFGGRVRFASSIIALGIVVACAFVLAPDHEQKKVLVAGLIGMGVYLVVKTLDSLASPTSLLKKSSHAGLIGFLYLELIDASFSLDGVIGAFALTKDILLIAAGLGIGALFVRSMTVHLMRRGVLARYIYLEHGAHYAIGILAFLMLVSVRFGVPEFITGTSGLAVIIVALVHSQREAKQLEAETHAKPKAIRL